MDVFDAVVRYEVGLWGHVDRELGRQGRLSLAQLHALRVLDRLEDRGRVQDLSRGIGITVGAASKLVDRLEASGLATRSPHPVDRRSSVIGLTPHGREALAASLRVCEEVLARLTEGEDLAPLLVALDRLQARLDAATAVAA